MGLSSLVTLVIPLVTVIYGFPSPQLTEHGYLRLQPEIDQIDVEAYLRNVRLVKLQLRCLLLNSPCDIVGRWLKPRVKAALVGECLACTKKQKEKFKSWFQAVISMFPQFYRAAVAKYFLNTEVTITEDDKYLIDNKLSEKDIDKAVEIIKNVTSIPESQISLNSITNT